jgi:hypothetical protein
MLLTVPGVLSHSARRFAELIDIRRDSRQQPVCVVASAMHWVPPGSRWLELSEVHHQ